MLRFVLVACLMVAPLVTEAAWLRYHTATLRISGMQRAQTPPIPAEVGHTLVDIADVTLDNLLAIEPVDSVGQRCSVPPEVVQSLIRITSTAPLTLGWVTPLACVYANVPGFRSGQGALARTDGDVDEAYQERISDLLSRNGFDERLAAYAWQRCTAPDTGAPRTTANCVNLRQDLEGKGPGINNVIDARTQAASARAITAP